MVEGRAIVTRKKSKREMEWSFSRDNSVVLMVVPLRDMRRECFCSKQSAGITRLVGIQAALN